MSNSVFSDFCQAWVARFPGSELPAAWEEDVRANLKKHKAKVAVLKEEIEKEEMYVEYLDKLLVDIERHKQGKDQELLINKQANGSGFQENALNEENKRRSLEIARKQKFLDDHLEGFGKDKSNLHLDLSAITGTRNTDEETSFITVINVPSSKEKKSNSSEPTQQAGSNLTYTKTKKSKSEAGLKRIPPPRPPPKRSLGSRDSLNSVSSPTTPTSPMLSSTDDFHGSSREGINMLSPQDPLMQTKLSSSSEETIDEHIQSREDFVLRGRPDGHEVEEQASLKVSSIGTGSMKVNKIKELMANWENKPPISAKPRPRLSSLGKSDNTRVSLDQSPSRAKRKDSDSSSRGRMGSPSGKSHDSSDSETSWSRGLGECSPGTKRRVSGETRLDRLVRRPSGDRNIGTRQAESMPVPNPPLPLASKKPKAKPRSISSRETVRIEEPLYDTVANDEPIEDEYDNHLLYGTNKSKTDTIGSSGGGSSSADLGFDEPLLHPHMMRSGQSATSLNGSGTLSSSDTSRGSPSLARAVSLEEETNYVNIQYFLHKKQPSNKVPSMDTIQSDDEVHVEEQDSSTSKVNILESRPLPDLPQSHNSAVSDSERILKYKCILQSIVDSEAIYLEGLSVMLQYMKAMKVTLSTLQPVIPKEEFDTIFFKINELHDLHFTFHDNLKKQVDRWNGVDSIGHTFKMLATRTKIYEAFLNNYQKALDSLHRCTEKYPQFADLTRSIKLRSVKGQKQGQSLSLEDLLHKPVARVQKLSLCLQDLIKHTPEGHSDQKTLKEALNLVQTFLHDYNMVHADELFPHQERQQRHLVKNSFIVELSEGQRKLRHLFLFNDVLVCAKYKASSKKSEKFTFQLKWYIPLWNALIVEEPSMEPRESNPANIVALKTQTSSLRDQIRRIESQEEFKGRRNNSISSMNSYSNGGSQCHNYSKASEKHRKKLAEVEAQLVLASPTLLFQVTHKQNSKSFSFFLSSEYERSQWVETLQVLQSSLPANPSIQVQKSMSMEELQSWITSCRKFLKTNMGSFLMRSPRDEALLVGDLHFKLEKLQGLTRPADLYVVVEVDSYGHYFRKSKSQVVCNTMEPVWNEEFVIELEGSENLRILVYEQQQPQGIVLRGRATLELSRSWLNNKYAEQRISMNDVVLTCGMKYVTFEETIKRVPKAKSTGLFGTPIQVSAKRENRPVPFIITSCVREVERRGISEVGIYRVSGSAVDVGRLKKAYETNPYEAEQLLKECDIHSVAGILKLFLRDLPESLFTANIYQKMFEAYHDKDNDNRKHAYLNLFSQIPHNPNQACIVFLIEHIVRVSQYESHNKMSLHNLATVFGPTLLHAGTEKDLASKTKPSKEPSLATSTVDVMAQAGILLFFISRRARGEPIQIVERQV